MHSFKFLHCKVGYLLSKIISSVSSAITFPYLSKNIIVPFLFFPDFVPPPAKGDGWGKRERLLIFQNIVQEILSNDASRAKSVTSKFSFLPQKNLSEKFK